MGTKKGQVRKTARRAYEPKKKSKKKKKMSDWELLDGPDYYGKLWTKKYTNPKLHKELMGMKRKRLKK